MAWIAALVVGTALFHAIGDGPLSAPPLDPAGWRAWVEGRDPLVATFAVLRLLVLALSWYLVGATSIGILARLLRAARLVRIADALTLPMLRHFLQGALGVSLATTMVVSAVPPVGPADPAAGAGPTVVLRAARDGDVPDRSARADAVVVALAAAGGSDRVTLEHVPKTQPLPLELLERSRAAADTAEGADPERVGGASIRADTGTDPAVTDCAGTDDGRSTGRYLTANGYQVQAGDSFWTIANDTLAGVLGRVPAEAEMLPYWRSLVDANRDRLIDRDNPDLIFPGQTLVLPASGSPDGGAG